MLRHINHRLSAVLAATCLLTGSALAAESSRSERAKEEQDNKPTRPAPRMERERDRERERNQDREEERSARTQRRERPEREARPEEGQENLHPEGRSNRPGPQDEGREFNPRRQRDEGFEPRPQMRRESREYAPQFPDRPDFRRDMPPREPMNERGNFGGPRGPRPDFGPQGEAPFARRPQFPPEGRPPMGEMRRPFDRQMMDRPQGKRMGPPPRDFALGPRFQSPMGMGRDEGFQRRMPEGQFGPRQPMRREMERSGPPPMSEGERNFRGPQQDERQYDNPPPRRRQAAQDEANPRESQNRSEPRRSTPPAEQE